MGITIHYKGRLDNPDSVSQLVKEMRDIASVMSWPVQTLDDDWSCKPTAQMANGEIKGNLGLKGISLKPHPDSESLGLFFNRDGMLINPIGAAMLLDGSIEPENTWNAIKTQFAPPDIHVRIIGLLKYLKKKYISGLEVRDEAEFWDTGDLGLLTAHLDTLTKAIDAVEKVLLDPGPVRSGDVSSKDVAAEIERLVTREDGAEKVLKAVRRFENPAPEDKRIIRSLFSKDFLFPEIGKMDDIALDNKLDEIFEILEKNGVRVELAEKVPDTMLYEYIVECVIPIEEVLPPPGSGYNLVFNGCDGNCTGCFQKEFCESYQEMRSDEKGAEDV